MGLFGRDKPSKEAGQWAAMAMGCIVFADGAGGQAEVTAAQAVVNAMPVLKNSIGAVEAERLFMETVEAVRPLPDTMLDAYVTKLEGMAREIKKLDEKNFALAAVIAVSKGDGVLTQGEHQLIARLKDILGATIRLPDPGQSVPVPYQPQPEEVAAPEQVACAACGQVTEYYEGYGYWCGACQQYATAAEQGEASPAAEVAEEQAPAVAGDVLCGSCNQATQFFEGYGHWCATCQQYTAPAA